MLKSQNNASDFLTMCSFLGSVMYLDLFFFCFFGGEGVVGGLITVAVISQVC